ncbi:hypothetical protein GOB19_29760 [Sinorhizobium meliloti]|nr:hypothetical protein [Sinorhizobium meliloti]MDX0005139.1 hypothetical protein [Sinorhizobium meliloti]MDX0017131.1 hypothetical protein [Sinorhizobium meliloti]MDX0166553.1 hypothetical protein [Sinorhizobium meliloti]MDX0216292.1 hypothetical protein [Sinorhizobium meliloti]
MKTKTAKACPAPAARQNPKAPSISHSALIEDLTGHKTASLRIQLANQHHVALMGVVQTMLVSVAFPYN